MRTTRLFIAAVCLIALPELALAWSEQPAPANNDGSARFSDPDEQTQQMTGRDEDGTPRGQEQSRSFSSGNSNGTRGWSFSFSPGSSSSNQSETGGLAYGRPSGIPFQHR